MRNYIRILSLTLVTLAGCSKAVNPWEKVPGGNTRVLVTIPPLYSFAKSVAGDDAAVLCLLGAQGPHDYEPTPNDILKARKANLFLSVGLGLDDFTKKIADVCGNRRLKTVSVAAELPKKLLKTAKHDEEDEKEAEKEKDGHKHHDHHHHGEFDPHVWLGIPQAIKMVEHIKTTLQEADEAHRSGYEQRAKAYGEQLLKLQEEGRDLLKKAKNKKIIAMHESLRYFADSFGLEIVDSIQPRPGIEAEATQLAKLVKECKDKDVRVIAIEPQYKPAAAETLKKQLKSQGITVELVLVDPMETATAEDLDAGFYARKTRENITNLAKSLP